MRTTTLHIRKEVLLALVLGFLCLGSKSVSAQDNYEIQVYGSETVARGATMIELHNNFTAKGAKKTDDGTLPTNHAWHETIEITHGLNEWFETGFYIFTSARNGSGWDYVGSHIRPRFRVPPKWHWPVGVSISQEIGFVRRKFSEDTWSYELRPIIDKDLGKWYLAFNPALERALTGPGKKKGFEFAPNFKVAYSVTKKVDVGLEYYGALGPLSGFDPKGEQQHQIFPAIDLNVSPKWEFNFGVGIGMTRSTDHLILKMIIGRRFEFGKRKRSQPPRQSENNNPISHTSLQRGVHANAITHSRFNGLLKTVETVFWLGPNCSNSLKRGVTETLAFPSTARGNRAIA